MITLTKKLVPVALSAIVLAGCQQPGGYGYDGYGGGINRQTGGAALGGIVGGLAGSSIGSGSGRIAATATGALLGVLVGSEIGRSLDEADRQRMALAQQNALAAPVGTNIQWSNPQSGNYGYYTPVRDGRDTAGNYCREFQQTIIVGGRQQTGVGTACQQPDGSWRIMQ